MVRSSDDNRGFLEQNDDGDSRFHKHRDEEGHCSHESKSSKHKHKHHKHKNRRKHKKEASTEEMASDVGDCGVRDRGQSAFQAENMPKADVELANVQVKDVFESSERVIDVTPNEQVEMKAGMLETGEIEQIFERTFSGSDNLHKVDDEMEEGEILDEDTAVCKAQVEVLPMDFLPVDGLEQSHESLKVGYNVPLECISVKLSANANLEPRSDDSLGESRSSDMFMGRDETVNQYSPGGKDSGSNQVSQALVSPEKVAIPISSRLSPERVIERGGRSRSMSRDSWHLRDSLRQYDDERGSMSRDVAHKNKYAGSSHDRTDRVQQSRSKEVDTRTWHEDINSRSRDHRRLEYTDRRMSPSRSGRDYLDRRCSRSRGGYGDYMDQRRRSRSIERSRDCDRRRSVSRSGRDSANRRRSRSRGGYWDHMDKQRRSRSKERSRDQKAIDSVSYRGNKLPRGGGFDNASEGQHKLKSEEKNLKEVDKSVREEENEDEKTSALSQSEGEDVDKEVEKIRLRRQAIVEKHKKQDQLENMKNMDLNVGLDVNELTGSGNATILLDEHASEFVLDKGSLQNGIDGRPLGLKSLGQGTPKSEEKPNNMVSDYIFGESPAGGRKQVKGDGMALETSGLTDNWDDAEGYYCHRIGEVLDGRYEIAASHGRGVFSSVVRARDLKTMRKDLEEIAIKIIRNNDVMLKSGQQELSILRKLDGADPENRRHCVRFLTNFDYRKHLCLVFESMHMNLREVLKKFGRNIGLNLGAVRAYAKQLFIALKHLRNCGVLHCDIKPDNMLVNEAKNVLKLCDFGSAMFAGENEITPYLVSRFYRGPEIILGLPYDHPLDMWSVGCCLYEFFTGKVLFPGPTNNDMLRLHMELKGPFPKKMLKKATFVSKHFDQDYNFCAVEEDPVTKASIKRVLVNVKPKDIAALVTGQGTMDENGKMLNNFRDLLDKIFMLDPEKRLTVSQALSHPFITGK